MLADYRIEVFRIQGLLSIEPYDPRCLQPASYDVHIAPEVKVYAPPGDLMVPAVIDPSAPYGLMQDAVLSPYNTSGFFSIITPQQFMLAHTTEYIKLTPRVLGKLEGRSSLGRLGLLIHATAGLLDPGWEGSITLELFNAAPYPIRLWAGMSIGQVTFEDLEMNCHKPYGHPSRNSKYQGDRSVQESRYHIEVSP